MGHSMGGHGALTLGIRNPVRIGFVAEPLVPYTAHSHACDRSRCTH